MSKAVVSDEMVQDAWRAYKDSKAAPDVMFRTGLQNLLDRGLISLPVNAEEIRNDVIREVSSWVASSDPQLADAIDRNFLPTIDEAEKLASEYYTEQMGCEPLSEAIQPLVNFGRWLLSRKESRK